MTDSQIILMVVVIIPLLGSLLIEWAVDKLERKRKAARRRQGNNQEQVGYRKEIA